MEIEISPVNELEGEVKAPPSKSYTHRAIILAGLSKGTTIIREPLLSADPLASIEAVKAAGAEVEMVGNELKIKGNEGKVRAPGLLDVKNSGTTLRIMASVFSLAKEKVELTGDESIKKRPMAPLLDALSSLGVKTDSKDGRPPVTVTGPIAGNEVSIRGDLSSQFISGLLIAAPLRKGGLMVNIEGELKSRPYLELTLEAMEDFGIKIANDNFRRFVVPGKQTYSNREYLVEGDYSGAAFILAASVLTNGIVTVKNLSQDSKQGDRLFVDILKMMGANVRIRGNEVTILGGKPLRCIDIDLSQTPDLLPITAVMCALANGKSRIYNVAHARVKECDRISAMAEGLQKMGVSVEERQDGLEIEGKGFLNAAQIESRHDHRIVMAFAVAALRANGNTRVNHAESVKISYPDFIEDLRGIGAKIETNPSD